MTFDDREREQVRRGLGVLVEETPIAPDLHTIGATSLEARPSSRRPMAVFVTASAAVLIAVGGVALLQTSGSGQIGQIAHTVAAPDLAPGELPYLVPMATGWAITYVERSDGTFDDGSGEFHHATVQLGNEAGEAELNLDSGAWSDLSSLIADREQDGARLDDATVLGTVAAVVQGEGGAFDAMWAIDEVLLVLNSSDLDETAFRTLLASLALVDEEQWLAAMPETVVTDRAATVAEYLTDIPLPPGFDASMLEQGPAEHWYQVGADVAGALACAWIEQWIGGKVAQDQAAVDEAVNAMATSREWDILIDMSAEGGFSGVLWEYADAIAGDGTVVGGRVLTVEESYRQAFSCPG
ncbi:MAG: hypothetical protein ACRDX9_08125 [Acidimicrobiia bacterium]